MRAATTAVSAVLFRELLAPLTASLGPLAASASEAVAQCIATAPQR